MKATTADGRRKRTQYSDIGVTSRRVAPRYAPKDATPAVDTTCRVEDSFSGRGRKDGSNTALYVVDGERSVDAPVVLVVMAWKRYEDSLGRRSWSAAARLGVFGVPKKGIAQ